MLRKANRPVVLVVNKVDHVGEPPTEMYEFYNLGLGEVYPISASHRLGLGEMLDALYEHFPKQLSDEEENETFSPCFISSWNDHLSFMW